MEVCVRSPCREPPPAANEKPVDPAFPGGPFTLVEAISMRWNPRFFPRVRITVAALAGAAVLTLTTTALAPSALAQSLQTGNITGKVSDNTGARAPGVTVTLTSPVLITPRTVTTDQEGSYRFPALPPGTYALAFELKNFRKLTRSNVPVSLATTLTIDATLEVGSFGDAIEVAGAPLVDVTQTNVATNLDVNALQGIPTARDVW